MFDFPNSPTVGQIITGPNGIQYQWDGVKWLAAGSLGSSQPFAPAGAINDVGRNLIHNPLFAVAQRGIGPWTAIGYTLDRWNLYTNLDTVSVIQQGFVDATRSQVGDEAARFGLANTFTGSASAGAQNYISQRIEDVRRLGGKTVTVSFWAYGGTALKLGVLLGQIFGSGGSPSTAVYVPTQTVTMNPAAMQRYSLTFSLPSTAGKTLGTNNNDYTELYFMFSQTTSSPVGTQSGSITLWGVQLEIGSVATPLEKPDPQQDLAKCQRFFSISYGNILGYVGASAPVGQRMTFPVAMRAVPMLAVITNGTAVNCGQPTLDFGTTDGFRAFVNGTAAGLVACDGFRVSASADL